MMKEWKAPEMQQLDVSMTENGLFSSNVEVFLLLDKYGPTPDPSIRG